jgi:hypothetical protein
MTAFAQGWVPTSNRVVLEQDWIGKLGWFVLEPLQNAFALIVLNDNQPSSFVYRAAAMVAVIILGGVACEWQTRGWRHGLCWLAMLGALVLASFSVNLLVADRWPVYRVLLPLTAVIAVFCIMSLLTLGGRTVARAGVAVLVLTGALLARLQTFDLIAWPQGLELSLMEQGAEQINLRSTPSVFVITPTGSDRTTEQSFRDEFGSLSTDSDWVPKEMLALIMQELHPNLPDVTARYTFACGRELPIGETFDYVIDLRRLRTFRKTATAPDLAFTAASVPTFRL